MSNAVHHLMVMTALKMQFLCFLFSPKPFDILNPDTYDPACSDNSPEINYLNQASVKSAIHISSSAPDWRPCR